MINTLAGRIFRGTLATGITVSLLVLMNHLITVEAQALGSREDSTTIRFGPVELDKDLDIKDRVKKPKPPKKPQPPPKSPTIPTDDNPPIKPTLPRINMPRLPGAGDLGIGPGPSGGSGLSDGAARVKAAFPPQYPPGPLRSRIEGSVTVAFTITETGQVIDAEVLDSAPPRAFDRAALAAILKWRFWPKIENGQAVAMRATQTIDFSLEDH